MFVFIYLIFICNFHYIFSCGCYGSNSCTPNGILCSPYELNNSCLCDCCPPCNTCEQFFQSNCLSHLYSKHYGLSINQSDLIAKINQSNISYDIIDKINDEHVRYLWNPCLRRSLPNGIYLINDNEGRYKLVGIPREKLEKTSYEILFKGPVSLLILIDFTITII
ncbi:unnamed protein product [Adineta steineri]|uniref:Uncharacterized protein n=1 Tax=Adineta steineri TaxID=433720 RepID=A0A814KJI0_9BILA|nr:unnamed protein product [Adineta steineri]